MYIPQISKCLMHQNGMPEITWPSRHQLEHMVQGGSYFREESKSKLIQLNLADHWVTNCQGKGGELFNELFSTWLIAWFWWCLCCETCNFNMHVNFPEMKWKLTSYIAQHQWCYYCIFYLRIDFVVLFTGNKALLWNNFPVYIHASDKTVNFFPCSFLVSMLIKLSFEPTTLVSWPIPHLLSTHTHMESCTLHPLTKLWITNHHGSWKHHSCQVSRFHQDSPRI